jgi:hypothetical protein
MPMVARHGIESKERPGAPPGFSEGGEPSEEFLGQRDDDARRASHVAEYALVLVLGHLADEFGAVGAQASDSTPITSRCATSAASRRL